MAGRALRVVLVGLAICVTEFLLVATLGRFAAADTVSIVSAGGALGGGITRARGRECFVLTASHVVKGRDVRVVASRGVSNAVVAMSLEGDLAVLRLENPRLCSGRYRARTNVEKLAAAGDSAFVRWRDENGHTHSVGVEIREVFAEIAVLRLAAGEPRPRAGLSGSPVFVGSRVLGLIGRRRGGTGEGDLIAYRIDSLNDRVNRYFRPTPWYDKWFWAAISASVVTAAKTYDSERQLRSLNAELADLPTVTRNQQLEFNSRVDQTHELARDRDEWRNLSLVTLGVAAIYGGTRLARAKRLPRKDEERLSGQREFGSHPQLNSKRARWTVNSNGIGLRFRF